MVTTNGRYSKFIRPATYFVDICAINLLVVCVLPSVFNNFFFLLFVTLFWTLIAINIAFYDVYRYTNVISIVNKTLKQYLLFTILCLTFSGFYLQQSDYKIILLYTAVSVLTVMLFKIFVFYFLKKYRQIFKANLRKVVILGKNNQSEKLVNFFNDFPEIGYDLRKVFDIDEDNDIEVEAFFKYVITNNIDEIYCSFSKLDFLKLEMFAEFADNNRKILKFIPLNNDFLNANFKISYYGYIPVAALRDIPQDEYINVFIKRLFDIIFSFAVIIFLLSWLIPILALIIKCESKGPIFFKQGRPGIDENEFFCYKFRSMKINITTEKEASKNDPRVTRVGKFIRKTSLDEMPQFFNVLLGDMSVVGPRPHLWSQNVKYGLKVKKYMVRHFVKPGITGLAQVKGLRGEIESDDDMIKRINFDVFYIENWSIFLDIKIIVQTVVNIFKGEEKAY